MEPSRPRRRVAPLLAAMACGALTLSLGAAEAEAKFVVVNTGDAFYEVSELPQELLGEVPRGNWKLGYMCSHLGIFWADVWTWGCELVAFEGNTYTDLPPEIRGELEAAHSMSDAQRGLWNRFGAWALAGLVVLGAAVGND